jgi:ArsR family transcriptional regulator
VSHHLRVLTEAGSLARERRGTWMFYRLVLAKVEDLRTALALPDAKVPTKRSA